MRVLLTTDTIGGVWTFTQDLVSELLRRGHDVALISFGRSPSQAQHEWCTRNQLEFGSMFESVSSDVPLEWMEANADAYSAGTPVILEMAARFAPDIVHSSQFCYGRLPLGIPIVITAHSDVLSWAAACQSGSLPDTPWLRRYLSLVEEGLANASTVVAPTRWMLKALQNGFTFSAPAQAILNGRSVIPPMLMKPRSLQAVSVGRLWDRAKNLLLLAAIRSPMPIFIAGEQQHESMTVDADLGDLIMLGHLNEADLFSLFASSSIYIAASIYEPFGLAPLEAALCGCAVVAYDIPSLREVWGPAALYFSDVTTLERILLLLQESREYLAMAQKRSFDRARQLTSGRMADQYIDLYNSLLYSQDSKTLRERATHVC